MIGVIATLRVQPGKEPAFEAAFAALSAAVRLNEPGNVLYQLTRIRTEPRAYKVLELYRTEADIKAHGASDHFRAAGPKLAACLEGASSIEYLDAVG